MPPKQHITRQFPCRKPSVAGCRQDRNPPTWQRRESGAVCRPISLGRMRVCAHPPIRPHNRQTAPFVEEHAPESNFLRVCRKKAAIPRSSISTTWENGEAKAYRRPEGRRIRGTAAKNQTRQPKSEQEREEIRASSAARGLSVARRRETKSPYASTSVS